MSPKRYANKQHKPAFKAVLTIVAVEPATLGRFQVFVKSVFLKRPAPKSLRLRYNVLNIRLII